MVDFDAGILAGNGWNARLDLSHHLCVLRVLLRERASGTGLILRIKFDRIYLLSKVLLVSLAAPLSEYHHYQQPVHYHHPASVVHPSAPAVTFQPV